MRCHTYTEQGAFLDGLDTPEQRQQARAVCWTRWAQSWCAKAATDELSELTRSVVTNPQPERRQAP
jgi:hypothetical protein